MFDDKDSQTGLKNAGELFTCRKDDFIANLGSL